MNNTKFTYLICHDPNILFQQGQILKSFVFHLACYRAISTVYTANSKFFDESSPASIFWVQTFTAHIMVATLHWCKVFGSYSNDETHWKNTLIAAVDSSIANQAEKKQVKEALNVSFRDHLLKTTGLSWKGWLQYHKKMCSFRNKFVAHHDPKDIPLLPFFDVALKAAYTYESWSNIGRLKQGVFYAENSFEKQFNDWFEEMSSVAEKAMMSTMGKSI